MASPGRVIIIGASSGIGREMALWFARRQWRVGITGRRKGLLDETAALFPDAVVPAAFDAAELDMLPARLDALADRLGGVDLLVISAGTGDLNGELAPEIELRTAATNVDAFTAAAVWGFNHFRKAGRGHLAAITSVAGLLGDGAAPAYPASKAYQIMYLDSLRKQARRENIACRITELRPGFVDTDMMKGEGHFWVAKPEDAASLACRAIIGGRKLQYISRRWSLIGFALRLLSLFS